MKYTAAYSRTIYSFAIPEVLVSEDNVRKEFRLGNLLERLRKNQPMQVRFEDFETATPIYDFSKPHAHGPLLKYSEEFWGAFWTEAKEAVPVHFPFQARYMKEVGRDMQGSNLHLVSNSPLVKCRYFPYGAASIHLTEFFSFMREFSAQEVVDVLYRRFATVPINYSEFPSLPAFFQAMRNRIRGQVLQRGDNYYQPDCRPQSIVVHALPDASPDAGGDWSDIATWLAMDQYKDPAHIEQYTAQNCPNLGHPGQYIGFSPYACVLQVPNVKEMWRKRRLRNHVGSVAELVAIQQSYLKQLYLTYRQRLGKMSGDRGYAIPVLKDFVHSYREKLGREISSLSMILDLQSALEAQTKRSWYIWYKSLASRMGDDLKPFGQLLAQLNTQNQEFGADVRNALLTLTDKVTALLPGH